ncbi:MAG: peptide chain release factor N(5)-glutamine methyltransferase [Ruminococcaceae bacterium]|nr:peptide chain release factor N(5)-glutamine methyltransferase [Oscillospiraceae bacterium]
MTYREICNRFAAANIDNPEWDAALLLAHFCKVSRIDCLANPDTDHASPALAEAVSRRAARYPLQYLLGEWQFYRQTYEVGPDCLIPRSDTELLVETAVRLLPRGAYFADLCTGSGCIAISTLAERPDTRALAVEKFPRTLALAVRNAEKNAVSARFEPLQADVLEPSFLPHGTRFDAILSNPPYIRPDVIATLAPELAAEPLAALDGGEDGLCFYRAILSVASAHLASTGFLLLEIGYDQAEAVSALAREHHFSNIHVLRDLGGCDRALLLRHDGSVTA